MGTVRTNADNLYRTGIALLVLGLLATVFLATQGRNDLDIFREASEAMLQGQDPYRLTYNQWYSYFYSPFFALLIAPLIPLGPVWSKLVWSLLMLGMAWRCGQLFRHYAGSALAPVLNEPRTWFFILLFLFQPLRDNINSAQVTVFVVWASLEGLHRSHKGQWLLAATLIGIAVDMKLIPLVLLPYLVYRREWLHAVAVVVAVIILNLLPALVLGWEQNQSLLASRQALIDPSDVRHVLDEEEPSFISLGSLLSAYLSTEGGNSHTLDLPRNLLQLSTPTIGWLLLLGRLGFAALTLYFLRWPPFRYAPSMDHFRWEVAYLLLCTILIFPHQRNYSMFLAAPAVAWLLAGTFYAGGPKVMGRAWTVALALCFLGMNAEMLLGEFAPLYDHYKLKSFITLLLIGLLMRMTPERAMSHRNAAVH